MNSLIKWVKSFTFASHNINIGEKHAPLAWNNLDEQG